MAPTLHAGLILAPLLMTLMTVIVDNSGSAGGTSLESASVSCQGPNTPLPITGSNALAVYAGNFKGVSFTTDRDPNGVQQFWVLPLVKAARAAAASAPTIAIDIAAKAVLPTSCTPQGAGHGSLCYSVAVAYHQIQAAGTSTRKACHSYMHLLG